MNARRTPRRGTRHTVEEPVVLPHVLITVDHDGNLTATVDGRPVPPPEPGAWTRATFGPLMDTITENRTLAVRIEVHEANGSVFTDVIRARAPRPAARPAPGPVTRPGRRTVLPWARRLAGVSGQGFTPGENLVLAVVVGQIEATDSGHVRAVVNLDALPPGSTGEAILFGRTSTTTVLRRLR
jgi:hypothetical protein